MNKIKLLKFISFSMFLIIGLTLDVNGQLKRKKKKADEPESTIQYCDTILRQFYRTPELFTPKISNIDPEIQVTPVTLGDLYCYQIEFSELALFRIYEIWVNDIKVSFNLDENKPTCSKVGDKIICLIDQIKLGNECLINYPSDTDNKFDCIYKTRWNIKVRGVICDSVYGPWSATINNVSLQCSK